MEYKVMTDEEVVISKIKNIRYIEVIDLFDSPWTNDKAVTSLIIEYKDEKNKTKYLNYCEKDKVFDFYINKVFETYINEKDENNITFGNKETKNIFENGLQIGHKLPLEKYLNKKGTNKLLSYQKDEINGFKNIIIYYIKQISKLLGNEVIVEDKIYGNREIFSIKVTKNGREVLIPFSYQKENESIKITINNLTSSLDFVVLNINFASNKTNITWTMNNNKLKYEAFVLHDAQITEYLISEGKMIFYNSGKLKNEITDLEKEFLNNVDESNNFDFYKLPWGDYLVSKKTLENFDKYFIETVDMKYISVSDNYINLLEIYNKYYRKYDKNVLISTMKLDGMKRVKEIYLIDKLALISNSFDIVPYSLSKYKTSLEGKTFYEVAVLNEKTLKNLNELLLNDVDLSKIKHKNDLLDEKILKLMIRGN